MQFRGLDIYFDERVLRPYPATALTVNVAIEALGMLNNESPSVCEIGVGSGNIAVSMAKAMPIQITAIDIDAGAIEVAKINARTHSVLDRIRFFESDMFEAVDERFDLIVCNPPYFDDVETERFSHIGPKVSHSGGGIDGLNVTQRVICEAEKHLHSNGYLVLEVQHDNAQDSVMQMLDGKIWRTREAFKQGSARSVRARKH